MGNLQAKASSATPSKGSAAPPSAADGLERALEDSFQLRVDITKHIERLERAAARIDSEPQVAAAGVFEPGLAELRGALATGGEAITQLRVALARARGTQADVNSPLGQARAVGEERVRSLLAGAEEESVSLAQARQSAAEREAASACSRSESMESAAVQSTTVLSGALARERINQRRLADALEQQGVEVSELVLRSIDVNRAAIDRMVSQWEQESAVLAAASERCASEWHKAKVLIDSLFAGDDELSRTFNAAAAREIQALQAFIASRDAEEQATFHICNEVVAREIAVNTQAVESFRVDVEEKAAILAVRQNMRARWWRGVLQTAAEEADETAELGSAARFIEQERLSFMLLLGEQQETELSLFARAASKQDELRAYLAVEMANELSEDGKQLDVSQWLRDFNTLVKNRPPWMPADQGRQLVVEALRRGLAHMESGGASLDPANSGVDPAARDVNSKAKRLLDDAIEPLRAACLGPLDDQAQQWVQAVDMYVVSAVADADGTARAADIERLAADRGRIIPHEFFDPISLEIMVDPVTNSLGRTYERVPLAKWLTSHDTDPLSNSTLPSKQLLANDALRELIHVFADELSA